jgi:hypothetical protein
MEADWSVALGADDPWITVPWSAEEGLRFLDLRRDPQLVNEIQEARASKGLASALLSLNGDASPFSTAKCGLWTTSAEQGEPPADPYELDAEPGATDFTCGSYIDLVAPDTELLWSFDGLERWMRTITERLRVMPSKASRMDLVLRRAEVHGVEGFAVSWFVVGCGATAAEAVRSWEAALQVALQVIVSLALSRSPDREGTMEGSGE